MDKEMAQFQEDLLLSVADENGKSGTDNRSSFATCY